MLFFDYYYFYAVGLLTHSNLDPYTFDNYRLALLSIGYPISKFIPPFPYPFWSLWFFYLIALFSYNYSLTLFLILNFFILLYSSNYIFNSFILKYEWLTKFKFAILFFTYIPTVKTIFFAQLSIVIFGTLLLVLSLYEKKKYFYSGLLSSFLLIKPHLVIASLVYLFCKSLRCKFYNYSLGLLAGIMTQLYLTKKLFNFEITHFYKLFELSPHGYLDQDFVILSATVVNHLSNLLNIDGLKYISIIISIIIGIGLSLKSNRTYDTVLYILSPLALFLSPYAWSHDYVLLFPALVTLFLENNKKLSERQFIIIWLILNIILSFLLYLQFEHLFFLLFLVFLPKIRHFKISNYVKQ
jgi:hypothetical protein